MKKLILVVVVLAAAVMWSRTRDRAPLSDGMFLSYQQGDYTTRVTFSEVDGGYRTAVEVVADDGRVLPTDEMTGQGETVSGRMRTDDGRILELGSFGPLWVPPDQVREGGSAHGTRIGEVRSWESWTVGVVSASVGMGAALRGEWYYDQETGFLVGGMMGTALSGADGGTRFTLAGSNLPELGLR